MKPFPSLLCCLTLLPFSACGQDSASEEEQAKPSPPKAIAILDIKNSKEGSVPGGSSIVAGKWSVVSESEALQVSTEPLVVSRLEFGPEIREKGATILATGQAPGEGRIQSRFGAGLYGKNGFQLRLLPIRDELELVRRGAVLRSVVMPVEPGRSYTLELTIRAEEDQWVIEGFAWDTEKGAEEATAIGYRIYEEELLFPLAGRPVLTGTPFSGEPVSFSAAQVFPEGYVREGGDDADPEEETSEEETSEEQGED